MKKSEEIRHEFDVFRKKCLNRYSYGVLGVGGSLAAIVLLVSLGPGAVVADGLFSGAAFISAGAGTKLFLTGAAILSAGAGTKSFIKGNEYQKKAVSLKEDFYNACSDELQEEKEKRDKKLMELQVVIAKLHNQKMQLETIKIGRQERTQSVEVQPQVVNQPLEIQAQEPVEIEQPTHNHII